MRIIQELHTPANVQDLWKLKGKRKFKPTKFNLMNKYVVKN